MTSLRDDEEFHHEKTLVSTRIEVFAVRRAVRRGGWPDCNEAVELADAGSVRLAHDHVLAGRRYSDPEQDPAGRISRAAGVASVLAPQDDGALGAHDARRTREIQGRHARPLRTLWADLCGNESLRPSRQHGLSSILLHKLHLNSLFIRL